MIAAIIFGVRRRRCRAAAGPVLQCAIASLPQPARLAGRLQEGAGDVEELRHVEQEGVVPVIGLDLRERHPRARGIERMHQRARFRGREQPVAGERHHAEPGLDAAERPRQHAVMVGGDVEIVHRPRQIEIAVGVEALDKGRALVAQIALDLEIGVERECRQIAVLHPPAELAMQRRVRKIGDVRGHPRDAEPAMRKGALLEIAPADASPDRPSRPAGRVRGTRCSAPSGASSRRSPAPRTRAPDRPRSIAAPACRPSSRRPRRTACRCRDGRAASPARAPCREW